MVLDEIDVGGFKIEGSLSPVFASAQREAGTFGRCYRGGWVMRITVKGRDSVIVVITSGS